MFSLALLAYSPSLCAKEAVDSPRRMWVIYYKTEISNPKPGTWAAELPIFETYYDASSVRSIGHKRFVETASCSYRRWKPGEPMVGSLFCDLKAASVGIIGIDCKNNAFLYSGQVAASPEWKPIRPESSLARLKAELC